MKASEMIIDLSFIQSDMKEINITQDEKDLTAHQDATSQDYDLSDIDYSVPIGKLVL